LYVFALFLALFSPLSLAFPFASVDCSALTFFFFLFYKRLYKQKRKITDA
jgi:hypothetical protein